MEEIIELVLPATWETIYMLAVSGFFGVLFGLPLSLYMFRIHERGLSPNPGIYSVLDVIVNVTRSFPFIILMIFLLPLSGLIAGSRYGTNAAIVPLAISAIPFLSRLFEQAFLNIDRGKIEAAQSMGASDLQILTKVVVPEAIPEMILAVTNMMISLMGYTAMAGTIGGGGLGALAKRYGHDRYRFDILLASVIVIIILVQLIQFTGNKLSVKINKKA